MQMPPPDLVQGGPPPNNMGPPPTSSLGPPPAFGPPGTQGWTSDEFRKKFIEYSFYNKMKT